MSTEKMTQGRRDALRRNISMYGRLSPMEAFEAFDEMDRARESEEAKSATLRAIGERLLSAGGTRDGTIMESLNFVLSNRDAKIKALADALRYARTWAPKDGATLEEIDAALRLVGKLP